MGQSNSNEKLNAKPAASDHTARLRFDSVQVLPRNSVQTRPPVARTGNNTVISRRSKLTPRTVPEPVFYNPTPGTSQQQNVSIPPLQKPRPRLTSQSIGASSSSNQVTSRMLPAPVSNPTTGTSQQHNVAIAQLQKPRPRPNPLPSTSGYRPSESPSENVMKSANIQKYTVISNRSPVPEPTPSTSIQKPINLQIHSKAHSNIDWRNEEVSINNVAGNMATGISGKRGRGGRNKINHLMTQPRRDNALSFDNMPGDEQRQQFNNRGGKRGRGGRGRGNFQNYRAAHLGSAQSLNEINSTPNDHVGFNQRQHNFRGRGHNKLQQPDRQSNSKAGFFGFKKLEELLTKQPEDALMIFINNIEKIKNYLHSTEISPDMMVLMFEVLATVIRSTFAESVSQLLLVIVNDDYQFFGPVKQYIMQLPLEDSAKKNKGRRFWNEPDKFFENVSLVLDALVEVLPSTAIDIAPDLVTAILYTMPNIESMHRLTISEEVFEAYEELEVKLAQLMTKKEEQEKKKAAGIRDDDEETQPPPNDFRDIDVYPTALEITTRTQTYLRKNLIKGSYDDVYHYLDVQFRLLREDFVAPLRDGICEYFDMIREGNQKGARRLSNIKIYKDVRCLGVVPNVNQVGYLVQVFKPKSIKNLDNSRRFMFGSLVCLTADNFSTIIFGKIIDRDKKFLQEGQLVVGFDVGVELDVNCLYIFVECTIYFEPYYQVLTALKHMDMNRFPFKEYLVDVRVDSELPEYLRGDDRIDLTNERKSLNPSQLAAFEAAMKSKFCIVQGPPGTGKTYLALKVAHRLLDHKALWQSKAPMLVICYTNHALDQFLEGLLPKTTKLVRVGGQSKNEKLQPYNLRSLRVKNVPSDYFHTQRQSKYDVEHCSRKLSQYGGILKTINEYACVLHFSAFADFVVDPEFDGSWFNRATNGELLNWLLYQPQNRNEVKFADFQRVAEMLEQIKLENEARVEEDQEEEDDTAADNPLNTQQIQNKLDLDVDEELEVKYETNEHVLYDVHKTRELIAKLAGVLNDMRAAGLEHTVDYLTATGKLIKLHIDYDYVCQQLRMLMRQQGTPTINVNYQNPNLMPANDRWLLYGHWLQRYKNIVMEQYVRTDQEYRQLFTKFTEVKDMLDLYKLKQVDVIGMTTTGAARLHKTLQALACPIVIVEEAAEVLEAHIITALSPACQHLILIGDHKQLKPSTADYKITKEYHLGVSLFERMVDNGLHCHTLNVQHRMRPEIANLVCPSIYPVLHNHESVLLYPNVRGVDPPLYFISHNHPEKESHDRSKENKFEAEYLILLARYLVLNNYDASRITIIAAYSGQWFVMLALKKKYHILRNMRICILDNFQGEENDIILLSLVRNNEEGKNGFLDLDNRICVALSRAKHGMYILGNMHQLCRKESSTWRQVNGVLEKYNAIGDYLSLRCVNHPESVTQVRDIADFNKVPEGGCLKICAKGLACGHTCTKLCHSTSHDDYKCNQPCKNILCEFGHICPDKCYQECDKCKVPKFSTLPCGHSMDIHCYQSPEEVQCNVKVPTTLPCGHQADKPCHADPKVFRCPHPCDARVEPCGHACSLQCHIRQDPNHEEYKCLKQCVNMNKQCQMPEEFKHPCQKRCFEKCDLCNVEVKKPRSCGHHYDLPCHDDVENVDCKRPCKRKLECGHNCRNSCNVPCGPCKVKVSKVISDCGHSIEWECGNGPDKTNCKSKVCPVVLDCGHQCPLPCAKICSTAKCMVLVSSAAKAPCGHDLKVPCHKRREIAITNELLSHCTEKCSAILACKHVCPGTCGECAQGRFHAACCEKCDKTLICGHGCVTPCVENCKPCTRPCEYRCEHSKCTKQCGAPCTQCNEPCNRRCEHQRCRRKCGEICDVSPCKEKCKQRLSCGHLCIGFCGDVCPPLCRICDEEEVTEIFLGHEDEEDARFVYLEHCKHTIESTGLDHHFGVDDDDDESKTVFEVKLPRCPRCKANVLVPRYRDYVKKAFKDVQSIKQEYFGHPKELKELTKLLKADLEDLKTQYTDFGSIKFSAYLYGKMKISGKGKHQRHDISKAGLISLRARLDIFKQLAELRFPSNSSPQVTLIATAKLVVDGYLDFLVSKLCATESSINHQQIQEFQMEIMRFNRIYQLGRALALNPSVTSMKEYIACHQQIFTFARYDDRQDVSVKRYMEALYKVANNGLRITEVERKQIVGALNLSPGHWFKCPNGHLYIITECGGAMQEAKCPECGLMIGGRNHALTGGNRLAPEMDGARAPAFPTINNIDLYRL